MKPLSRFQNPSKILASSKNHWWHKVWKFTSFLKAWSKICWWEFWKLPSKKTLTLKRTLTWNSITIKALWMEVEALSFEAASSIHVFQSREIFTFDKNLYAYCAHWLLIIYQKFLFFLFFNLIRYFLNFLSSWNYSIYIDNHCWR